MPLPQKMPSRSASKLSGRRSASRPASSAATRAIAVPRSSGTRDGALTAAASNCAAATGTGGSSMPGRSSAWARTAERPAKSASSKAARALPIGLTTPTPVTATAAPARDLAADDIAAGLGGDRLVEQQRKLLERDAGLARIEAALRDADVEAVLDREHEFHERERVEAELIERDLRLDRRGFDLELLDQDGGDGIEGRAIHADRWRKSGSANVILCPGRPSRRRRGRIRAPRQRTRPCPRPRSNSASPIPPPLRSPNGCGRKRSTRSSASATCSAPASRCASPS